MTPHAAVERVLRRTQVVLMRVVRPAVRFGIEVRHGSVVHATAIALHRPLERSVERREMLQKTRAVERVLRERTFERVLTTAVRLPSGDAPGPAGGAAAPVHRLRKEGASERLPMAMVRVPAAVAARAEPPVPPHVTDEAAARTPAHRPPRTAWVLPAEELSRVTEHVLRTFDRRVLSYRERTGQV